RRKLRAAIEHQVQWRPVRGERGQRRGELATATHLLAVAAVLGVQQELLLTVVVETERPAEVRTLHRAIERLRRALGVLLRGELARPHQIELIAVVHGDEERVFVPGDRGHLSQTGGELDTVLLLLPELVFVKLPDAGVLLENRAGILAW